VNRLRLPSALVALPLLACHASSPNGGAETPVAGAALDVPAEGRFPGDGASLFYRLVGTGPDVLVMIHGGPGMDMGYMVPDFAPLAKRHRLLFYDQRGGGRSEILRDDPALYTMARHVADLEALRRHFKLERMTLVAHSFGPAIAASYAIAHPDRVARMVFIGPVPPRAGDLWARYAVSMHGRLTAAERRKLVELEPAMARGPDPVSACRAYWAIATKPRVARPELASRVTGDFCGAGADAIRSGMGVAGPHLLASLGEWDFRAALAAVRAPTLIIHGEAESIPMDMVEEWTTALPDARLVKVAGASHFPYVEQPDLVWPAIEDFLARSPAPAYAARGALTSARLFAPGRVSTAAPEFATSFAPDGRTIYFDLASADRKVLTIVQSTHADGQWGAARPVSFSDGTYRDVDPFVSPDGKRLYFSSDRPLEGTAAKADFGTWYVERSGDGWGAPLHAGPALDDGAASEVFVSVTADGTVYFGSDAAGKGRRDIYRAAPAGGGKPERIALRLDGADRPELQAGNPCIDPQERFLIFVADAGTDNPDLFISWRRDGRFGPARNLGPRVNSPQADFAPALSPDGAYLFFTSERPGVVPAGAVPGRPPGDIYQVDLAPLLEASQGAPESAPPSGSTGPPSPTGPPSGSSSSAARQSSSRPSAATLRTWGSVLHAPASMQRITIRSLK
jgi:proline iminopeptidase